MTRERVRRSCGHLEAVYAVGFGVRRIPGKEREFCRICRERRKAGDPDDLIVITPEEEDDRKSSPPPDSSGGSGGMPFGEKQSSDKGDSK